MNDSKMACLNMTGRMNDSKWAVCSYEYGMKGE